MMEERVALALRLQSEVIGGVDETIDVVVNRCSPRCRFWFCLGAE
jgi:hypothetical protein